MHDIRVFFTKTGNARFISHLDMNRVFSRAVRRTDIPIWYTEGFNPHPYFSFSLPLSLGVESEYECVDMRLNDNDYPLRKVKSQFNDVLPEHIRVVKVVIPQMQSKDIYCGIFDISYETENEEELSDCLDKILSADELLAEKKQKSGKRKVTVEVNLLQGVITYSVIKSKNTVTLHLLLLSGANNINPMLLVNSIEKKCDVAYDSVKIRKIALFDENYRIFQ